MDTPPQVVEPYLLAAPVASAQEERHRMVSEGAYFLAQRRGFAPGHELDDWLCAEKQINEALEALLRI